MANTAAVLGAKIIFSDDSFVTVKEGDILTGILYKKGQHEVTIDEGRVRVVCARTTAYNSGPSDCPPEPYMQKYITPTQIIIDYSEENVAQIERINISDILAIDSVTDPADAEDDGVITVGPGAAYKTLDEVVVNAEEGATVALKAGTYEAPLTLAKSITLTGGEAGAVLTGAVNIDIPAVMALSLDDDSHTHVKNARVELSNLDLTGDALITVAAPVDTELELVIRNCSFHGHNMDKKTMPIHFKTETPVKLTIENCEFGEQNQYAYNLMEILAVLKDGSSISNNIFAANAAQNNFIALYNAEDNATITINNNYVEAAMNMFRIGFKGEPKNVRVVVEDNQVAAFGSDPRYDGMFMIQPYGKKTISLAGVTVDVRNATLPEPDSRLAYIYAGKNDTQWTAENKATVLLDGKPYIPTDVSNL